jgi:hypothetical protein
MFYSAIAAMPETTPCPGYPVRVRYPDVAPEELASEEACEVRRIAARPSDTRQSCLRRALPALERYAAAEMAEALLASGQGAHEARRHAATMARQSVIAGDPGRMKFWGEVLDALPTEAGA